MRKLWLGAVLALALGSVGIANAASTVSEKPCCCDFSNGKIVCKLTGQTLPKCCCKK